METHKHIEAYKELFDHLIDEHGLTLLQAQLDEIIQISARTVIRYNEASEASPFPSTESNCNLQNVSGSAFDRKQLTKEFMRQATKNIGG